VTPCCPRWACHGAPSELLVGQSKWRPELRLLGVSWWPHSCSPILPKGRLGGSQNRLLGPEGLIGACPLPSLALLS